MAKNTRKQEKFPMQKFTLKDFQQMFPDDDACLDYLRHSLYPELIQCENCNKDAHYYRISTRKVYGCEHCGHQISPTADTIFHKSPTPLTIWFYVIYLMAQTRCGISAKQIERETGVTYKTAWRMCKQIRSMLDGNSSPFSGDVEIDETYVGGVRKGTRGRGADNKTPVVGMVERKGEVKAVVVPNVQSKTILPIIQEQVSEGATIHTDDYQIYNKLGALGYDHKRIPHSEEIYVIGNVHTNSIEGFWAQVKNAVNGVHHGVAAEYLQHNVNEYAFRYSHRNDVTPMFLSFLREVFDVGRITCLRNFRNSSLVSSCSSVCCLSRLLDFCLVIIYLTKFDNSFVVFITRK